MEQLSACVGNRHCGGKNVGLNGLEPEFAQRRIEGLERVKDWEWPENAALWEYT